MWDGEKIMDMREWVLILKGEQDMEKLDTAKKSVRKEMYCVL